MAHLLTFITIVYHSTDPMVICTERAEFDLLAHGGFDGHWVCVEPFFLGHVCTVVCVNENVEHHRLVDEWQESDRGHNLFDYVADLLLNLCFWLCLVSV
jgi:hypothetical protein